jgi:Family of unknown function (DUF6492)
MFSIVLVLKRFTHTRQDNLQRFMDIAMPTYVKWLKLQDVKDFFVVVTAQERADIQAILKHTYPEFPWRIIAEDTLVHATIPNGWAKQQTAKLAIAQHVETDHYLIIDDDTFLTRPFGMTELLHNGRAIMNKTEIDFPFFFLWSAQVLGVDFDKVVQAAPFHMAITPEIFVTSVVRDLVNTLEKRHGTFPAWQRYLADHKFTEYCLYWIYLLDRGETDLYYATAADAPSVYGFPVTGPEHALNRRIEMAFNPAANHYFSFVQTSLAGISTEDVKQELEKYLTV